MNDRGRVVYAFFVLYLHALPPAEGGGLTVGHLAALCEETGICSRGRAKALAALMRWGGFIEPASSASGDRREKPLAPTRHMLDLFRARWREHFRAIEALDPIAGPAADAIAEPAFLDRLAIGFGTGYRYGYRILAGLPGMARLSERDGGALVLMTFLVSRAAATPPPSISDLSRRFHISRAQVRQILRHAADERFMVEGADGWHLTDLGQESIEDFLASMYCFQLAVARYALAA